MRTESISANNMGTLRESVFVPKAKFPQTHRKSMKVEVFRGDGFWK